MITIPLSKYAEMLADGLPAETIRKYTGLDESSFKGIKIFFGGR